MPDAQISGSIVIASLPKTYRVRVVLLSPAGAGVAGIAGALTIYRSRRGESPGVLITPTVLEIDAVNMIGLYELTLGVADIDRPGMMTLGIANAGIVTTYVHIFVVERSSWTVG